MKLKRFNTVMVGAVVAALLWLPLLSLAPASVYAQTAKNVQVAFASAARTASANSSPFSVGDADHLVAFLSVTAGTGTTPTLDVKAQDSPDGGTTWFDLTGMSFAQVTGSTSSQTVYATRTFSPKIRFVATIGGTTPSFTFSVHFISYKGNPIVVATSDANASNLTSGTIPLARIVDLTNTQVSGSAAIAYSKLSLTGSIVNADLSSSAAIASGKLAEDVARTASVTIPTAQVLTLNATPRTLVAAPGAGKITLIDEITCKLVFNSVAYTGSNALEFRYTNGSGAKVTADISSSFLNSASGTNYSSVKGVTTALTPVANAAVVVFVPTADPGAGNSDLVFTIKYRIITP
ncbi:MAG TPA: hypothetical protein VF747_06650 [Blastocatellia bacterium]|jgi:hypothetical protein